MRTWKGGWGVMGVHGGWSNTRIQYENIVI